MKTPFIVSILLFCIALTSCNTSEYMENPQEEIPFEENIPYSFDKITNPAVWAKFNSLKEMQDACQMPENWLKNISTENLVKTCMSYPLNHIYTAYENGYHAINVIIDGFNGFQELIVRSDAAEKLIEYYNGMHLQNLEEAMAPNAHKSPNSILNLGFMELLLSSGHIKNLYDNNDNINFLNQASRKKYLGKLKNQDVYSLFSLKHSILVSSSIKLKKGFINTSNCDSNIVIKFVNRGGNIELQNFLSI